MPDLAELELRIKSLEAETASRRLKDLEAQSKRNETAAGGLSSAFGGLVGKLKSAFDSIFSLKSALIGLTAALGVRQIFSFVTGVADLGDKLLKTSQEVGLSVEFLSKLRFAAEQSGTSLEELSQAFVILQDGLAQFRSTGQGPAAGAIARLGDDFEDAVLSGEDLEPLLLRLVRDFGQVEDAAQRIQIVRDLFGRGGAKFIQLFGEGDKGIEALLGRAKRFGDEWTEESARAADNFSDSLNAMGNALSATFENVLKPLFQPLADFFNGLAERIADNRDTVEDFFIGILRAADRSIPAIVDMFNDLFESIKSVAQPFIALRTSFVKLQLSETPTPFGSAKRDLDAIDAQIGRLNSDIANIQRGKRGPGFFGDSQPVSDLLFPIDTSPEQLEKLKMLRQELTDKYDAQMVKVRELSQELISLQALEHGFNIPSKNTGPLAGAIAELEAQSAALKAARFSGPPLPPGIDGLGQPIDRPELEGVGGRAPARRFLTANDKMIRALEEERAALGQTDDQRELSIALRKLEDNATIKERANIDALKEKYSDLFNSLREAEKLRSAVVNSFKAIGNAAGQAASDVLFFEQSVGDAMNSLYRSLASQALQKAIGELFDALGDAVGGLSKSGGGGGGSGPGGEYTPGDLGYTANARGNVFQNEQVVPFALGGFPGSGVFTAPTYFPMRGGRTGLAGEAGPEVAIAPLTRTPSGRLGVESVKSSESDRPAIWAPVFNVYANDYDSFRRSKKQVMQDLRDFAGG
jgi:hypothetical protein